MGSSRWAKIGKHYTAHSAKTELEKKGKSPEEIRTRLAEKAHFAHQVALEEKRAKKAPHIKSSVEEHERQEKIEKDRKSAAEVFEKAQQRMEKERQEKEYPSKEMLENVRNQAREQVSKKLDYKPSDRLPSRQDVQRARETGFYGHVLPTDFRRTSIISTSGRVR